jgi:hypothetical protein
LGRLVCQLRASAGSTGLQPRKVDSLRLAGTRLQVELHLASEHKRWRFKPDVGKRYAPHLSDPPEAMGAELVLRVPLKQISRGVGNMAYPMSLASHDEGQCRTNHTDLGTVAVMVTNPTSVSRC